MAVPLQAINSMSLTVLISNRQRRLSVDTAFWNEMTAALVKEVCLYLIDKPARGLTAPFLHSLCERGSLSLALVSNRSIRELNRQWRGKDYATDVISFPLELDEPPPGVPWEVGEIVISVEKAKEQAEQYGHSIEREFAFLFVHGFLHILGFDHETKREEAEMMALQSSALEKAGYSRTGAADRH